MQMATKVKIWVKIDQAETFSVKVPVEGIDDLDDLRSTVVKLSEQKARPETFQIIFNGTAIPPSKLNEKPDLSLYREPDKPFFLRSSLSMVPPSSPAVEAKLPGKVPRS